LPIPFARRIHERERPKEYQQNHRDSEQCVDRDCNVGAHEPSEAIFVPLRRDAEIG
jgi:hypothetical protein